MDEPQKPFLCKSHGCNMRFTNEDHLMVHSKKHDMILNLGPGVKTGLFVADQTPTPTRFIRNCEEVGLFQDLQNVNPFEETFRRAAELVKSGSESSILTQISANPISTDDTLHTPHVFPNLDAFLTKDSLKESDCQKNVTNDLSADINKLTKKSVKHKSNGEQSAITETIKRKFQNIIINGNSTQPSIMQTDSSAKADEIPTILEPSQPLNEVLCYETTQDSKAKYEMNLLFKLSDGRHMLLPVNSKHVPTMGKPLKTIAYPSITSDSINQTFSLSESSDVKTRLKNILQNKLENVPIVDKPYDAKELNKLGAKPKTPINVMLDNDKGLETPIDKVNRSRYKNVQETEKEQSKARNRAAAYRWRLKRKKEEAEASKRFQTLEDENAKLKAENAQLKILLLAHKECSVAKAMAQGHNIAIGAPKIIVCQSSTQRSTSEERRNKKRKQPRKQVISLKTTGN